VLEGNAQLVAGDHSAQLDAHQSALVVDTGFELGALSDVAHSDAAQLLAPATAWRKPLAATLDLRALTPDSEVAIDGWALGVTPLLAIIPAGPHRVRIHNEERSLLTFDFAAEPGKATTLALGAAADETSGSASQSP
jgi:hypothetical protein